MGLGLSLGPAVLPGFCRSRRASRALLHGNAVFEGRRLGAFPRVAGWGGERTALEALLPREEALRRRPGRAAGRSAAAGRRQGAPGGAGHAWRPGPAGKGHVPLTCGPGIGSGPHYIAAGAGAALLSQELSGSPAGRASGHRPE